MIKQNIGWTKDILDSLTEEPLMEIKQYISDNLLKISLLKEKGVNRETIPDIFNLYEDCARLVMKHRVSVYVMFDYAMFLCSINRHQDAIGVILWLLGHYLVEKEPEADQAALKSILGHLLSITNQTDESEQYFCEAEEIYRRLAEANPVYDAEVAMICSNIGGLLSKNIKRRNDAEQYFCEALKIYHCLAKANPAVYDSSVAKTCNDLGNLLRDTNRKKDAERYYREAERVYRRLADANPVSYEEYVAIVCHNLSTLSARTG